ncbi:RlmE family RNA methyltransferase [Enterobacteriaceae endosymbiont of Donacia semicuprea]|uniref:RlmE family RNA methyltransferase n=1 Tax=Enterobacteriaceae endosymbiont of Donacia semicuprea TaxID=2675783 RepID=UPI001448A5C0|nr:SAM-dependent methyltransferase [Enterobacteriaceae endosymbiont of Donacia semicuprea]QJC32970.1 23S rRNA (uridine(2552)-2'-O)-methyltransferase [Enterobacteriaceae endosymbiont of Donacia semicuprea]
MNFKKNKKSKKWLKNYFKDSYIRKAKRNINKFRSRSWFKLEEIEKKHKIFRNNITIIDLGSSPGGWSSFAASKIGKKGKIIACDILPMNPIQKVYFYQGNICNSIILNKILRILNKTKVQIIMSDMSPNISGIKEIDIPRIIHLNEIALKLCYSLLEYNGSFLIKTFQGKGLTKYYNKISSVFKTTKISKPNASRSQSCEIYIVAKKYKN